MVSMTYADLYSADLADYKAKWSKYYNAFKVAEVKDDDILGMKQELARVRPLVDQLRQTPPTAFNLDLEQVRDNVIAPQRMAFENNVARLTAWADEQKATLQQAYDAKVEQALKSSEESIGDLTKAYDELCSYRDKISDAVVRYDIKPSDIALDENLTRSEMEALVAQALESVKYVGDTNMRTHLMKGSEWLKSVPEASRFAWLLISFGLILVLAPFILITMFAYMCYNTRRIYKHVDGLRIADKLMFGIDFTKYKDDPRLEGIDKPDFESIDAQVAEHMEKLRAVGDPELAMQEITELIGQNIDAIQNEWNAATQEMKHLYTETLQKFTGNVEALQKRHDDFMNNLKRLGDTCSNSYVFNSNFTLGLVNDVIPETYDVWGQNIVFADRSPEMITFQRLMLLNALLNIRPKQLTVSIYDPERLGQDFATFLSKDTKDYVYVATDNFEKELDRLRNIAANNLRILDQRSINDFNKEAEGKGMVTLDYNLLFITSPLGNGQLTPVFLEFLKNSWRAGIMIWMVDSVPREGTKFFSKPFEDVEHPYPCTAELFSRAATTYNSTFAGLKDSGILYKPSFADKYLPRDKWWQENTDSGIKLNFGLQDGDPSKGFALELGDANVHGLCVGATGAGKSAFNNQLIASLVIRYPPSALELVMVDFKNIEFGSLVNKKTHISRIPHARIIAGTKDGEYAISVFDYLMEEMTRRTKLFDQASVKKLEDYNKKMRANGEPKKCIPRILVIIDEFQVMFTEVDPKSVEIIQERIRSLSKLARFCGCHLFFTSQSMKGTMAKDILDQFSLRVALRCSSDTSNDIIGSPIASKIRSKFGYLYTNTNAGETQDSTRLWRTPFLPDEDWFDDERRNKKIAEGKLPEGTTTILTEICQMADSTGELNHHAYFYDENEQYPSELLDKFYAENKVKLAEQERFFVLGPRTGFSLNAAPCNFKMTRTDCENLLVYGFESIDIQNTIMTLVTDIQRDPKAKLLINCADQDMFDILDIPKWYDPDLVDIARPMVDASPWLGMLEDIIDKRKESGIIESPIYFLAVRWDKQMGVYRNENYALRDRWLQILLNGPTVDVHIILCAQLYKDVKPNEVTSYNHVICCKGPDEASIKFLGTSRASRLPNSLGFALYKYGQDTQKFKLYQFTYAHAAESREVVL